MKQETERKILDILSSRGGYARAAVFLETGVHSAQLAELAESGSLMRLKRVVWNRPPKFTRFRIDCLRNRLASRPVWARG